MYNANQHEDLEYLDSAAISQYGTQVKSPGVKLPQNQDTVRSWAYLSTSRLPRRHPVYSLAKLNAADLQLN